MILREAIDATKDLYEPGSLLKVLPEPIRPFSKYESYLGLCGFSIAHLITLLEQIVMLPAYIEEYRITKSMRRYKVTRLYDISYHFENFVIRVKSIDDRLLQFFNSIAHLGFDLKDVKYHLIIHNSHIKSTGIDKYIKDIHNYCDRYGYQRNKIIHQHSILDEDLRNIELMLNASRQQDSDYKIFASSRYRVLIKEFVKKKVPEINDFLSNLLDKIIALLDSLEPIYETKKNSLIVKSQRVP